MLEIPDTITCVDCGQKAHRLTQPDEDGWVAGDIVAYRCSGCNDRWDLFIEGPVDQHELSPPGPRDYLRDREKP